MNVQELIDKLQEVKDKSLKVTAPDDNSCSFLEVIGITESLEGVCLTIKLP